MIDRHNTKNCCLAAGAAGAHRERLRHSPRKSDSGFTLLEVIVALGVMMIGIASAFALFAAATALHKRSVDQTSATIIAETIFSNLDSRLTRGADISELQKTSASLPEFPNYTYDLELIPLDDTGREIFVDLTVRWKTKGKTREQTFNTIRLRSLPFKEKEKKYPDETPKDSE